jgi:hypothetical protein
MSRLERGHAMQSKSISSRQARRRRFANLPAGVVERIERRGASSITITVSAARGRSDAWARAIPSQMMAAATGFATAEER